MSTLDAFSNSFSFTLRAKYSTVHYSTVYLCTNLLRSNLTSDTTLGTNLPHNNSDTKIGGNVELNLNLTARLDTLDGGLGEDVASLPYPLTDLFLLIIAVVLIFILVIGSLVAVGLGGRLWLGNLDLALAFAELDNDIALGGELCRLSDGDGGLGLDKRLEGLFAGSGLDKDAEGLGEVRGDGDHGVGGLVNVFLLVLGDEGGLDGGTTGGQLGWVEGGRGGGGCQDGGGLGEGGLDVAGNLGGVRGAAGKDNLVDVEDVEAGFLHGLLEEAGEGGKDLVGEKVVASAVDGELEVDTVGERLDGKGSRGTDGKRLLDGLGLQLELGEGAVVGAGIGLVLLHELLGGVVDEDLVELGTSELVVVGGGQDGVHATSAGNDGDVRAGATEVGNDDNLVLGGLVGVAGIVGEEGGDGLVDELQDLEAGIGSGRVQGGLLSIGEVGGDGDDGSGDLLAKVVGGGLCEAAQVAGGDFVDGDSVGVGGLLVLDLEGDRVGVLDWVCASMAGGRVY